MEKYQPYILIVIALVMPLVYHLFNFDDRGGLPAYRWSLFFVSIISYLILYLVFLGAMLSLIIVLKNPKENWREILDSSTRLTIVMLIVVLPSMFNDKQRFACKEDDLNKTINVNIEGKSLWFQ